MKEIESTKKKPSQAGAFATGEFCFILLPFVVMALTFCYKQNMLIFLQQPEWSLASTVMFGQSIIKMIHYIGKQSHSGDTNIYQYRIGAVISVIILLGLVPSLTVLSLIFTSTIIPNWIILTQMILFILSSVIFFLANGLLASLED